MRIVGTICFLILSACGAFAQQRLKAPADWQQKGWTITLKDDLGHPGFSWPQSLLQYPLDFGTTGIAKEQLSLTDEKGQPVAFQLTDLAEKGRQLQQATLNVLSDLPSGGKRIFRLTANRSVKKAQAATSIRITQNKNSTLLENGVLQVEIPAPGNTRPTAPVLRYGKGKQWLGHGEWQPGLATGMQVQQVYAGPLLAEYSIRYDFKNGQRYNIAIRLTAGMEFMEMEEEMQGFSEKDAVYWQMVWDSVHPRIRYVGTRTGNGKTYDEINFEPMEGLKDLPEPPKHPLIAADQENGPDGKLPFHLATYDNWMSWWRLPTAAFWNEKEAVSIGLFIKDMEKWDDGEYPIWGAKNNLSISYYWKNNVLDYRFPLVQGTRSTALAAYDHQKDIDLINKTRKPFAYIESLRRWHGWVPLDKVKNWILDYPSTAKNAHQYFTPELAGHLKTSGLEQSLGGVLNSMSTGTERNGGPTPVGGRVFYGSIAPSFDVNRSNMSPEQYRKLRAWFLFMGYVFMDESLMPIRTMLSGHPNFLADVKGIPGLCAYLFPDHPQAKEMAEHFEKATRLNYHYHIRPDVAAWNATGGRWTENLATYTWAALRPALHTNFLLHHYYDNRNRLLQPGVSKLGGWLLNTLTSPLDSADGKRTYPPQGAHALISTQGPPDLLRHFGQELYYYDPLLAEHIFYITSAEDKGFETKDKSSPWRAHLKGEWADNKGTAPHLKSEKYTGYGFVFRSNFGKKDEMYVHLQQIDDGPNYRWGRAAGGGNGVIYYTAAGKRYSFNGPEDVGDGPFGDVERSTNFGVKKTAGYRGIGPYRAVGRNDLTAPLYDLGVAQSATVYANGDASPDYRSRSVMQSGADYIVIFDDVANDRTEGRFSWVVGTNDDFPFIHQVTPGITPSDAVLTPSVSGYHKDPAVLPIKGKYFDGKGDFLTVATHRAAIKVNKTAYGCDVQLPDGSMDKVFRGDQQLEYNKDGISFKGRSGIVKSAAGALFEGTAIGAAGLRIQLQGEAGISFEKTKTGFRGIFQSYKPQPVSFSLKDDKGLVFYVDGIPQKGNVITFPAGKHEWQWTSAGVIPQAPVITGTIMRSKGCEVSWEPIPGAASCRVELSKDNGLSWKSVADNISTTSASITSLDNGTKVHLRVIAKGAGGFSEPSGEYPVYVNAEPPHAPEGLVFEGKTLTWGQILGAGTYKLYRRKKRAADYQLIYTGANRTFTDAAITSTGIFEYAVTSLNGNGESKKSPTVDTNPDSFLNWQPMPGEGFRRDAENHENGFPEFNPITEDKMPILRYPGHPDKKENKQ